MTTGSSILVTSRWYQVTATGENATGWKLSIGRGVFDTLFRDGRCAHGATQPGLASCTVLQMSALERKSEGDPPTALDQGVMADILAMPPGISDVDDMGTFYPFARSEHANTTPL